MQVDMQANMQAGVQANMQANMQADNGKNKRTRTHTDITIRSWQYRPAGKAQHRSDRTNTESSGSRPAGTKKVRHDAVHITNTESSGSRHKTFVANTQGATRSNTHRRISGHSTKRAMGQTRSPSTRCPCCKAAVLTMLLMALGCINFHV